MNCRKELSNYVRVRAVTLFSRPFNVIVTGWPVVQVQSTLLVSLWYTLKSCRLTKKKPHTHVLHKLRNILYVCVCEIAFIKTEHQHQAKSLDRFNYYAHRHNYAALKW